MATQPIDTEITAQMLYDEVLTTANLFLHNCKTFSIEMLKMEDPSYAQVAKVMRKVVTMITFLADDFDPMMGQKAFEYCELMHKIGVAIECSDDVALKVHVAELDRRPFS